LHDVQATALVLLASFYLHPERGDSFYARLPLLKILPLFVVFSIIICYVFNLATTKWRFHCCRSWHLPGAIRSHAC
jgi:hypothetical protein